MTVSDVRPVTPAATHIDRRVRVGLALALFLGVTAMIPPGNQGPPLAIILLDVVLGLVTIGGVIAFWRTANRRWLRLAAGALIVNAVTALPAFFVTGIPAWVRVVAAVAVVLTVVTVVLMLSHPRTDATV